MKKGFPSLQIINGRWRGTMQFRSPSRNLLEQQRRTGEPSPALYEAYQEEGRGKSAGSFTENMRHSLWEWMNNKYGSWVTAQLSFDYKLYRHKVISVVMAHPFIYHHTYYGKGKRGFILEGYVLSIDGTQVKTFPSRTMTFAWDRIIGKENFLALPEASNKTLKKQVER